MAWAYLGIIILLVGGLVYLGWSFYKYGYNTGYARGQKDAKEEFDEEIKAIHDRYARGDDGISVRDSSVWESSTSGSEPRMVKTNNIFD